MVDTTNEDNNGLIDSSVGWLSLVCAILRITEGVVKSVWNVISCKIFHGFFKTIQSNNGYRDIVFYDVTFDEMIFMC